jgi:hypothetical protein
MLSCRFKSDEFSVEVHHGGFFVGHGHLRTYVNGKVSWFDHVQIENFSPLWLDQFVEDLGYLRSGNLKYFWLLPGKSMADGLRLIISDTDTNVMASVVERHRNLVMYFDHDDTYIGDITCDDVIANPVVDLPKVISPKKVHHVPRKEGEKLPSFYTERPEQSSSKGVMDGQQSSSTTRAPNHNSGSEEGDSDDSDEDYNYDDFTDSDYEIEEDEDLFADNAIRKATKGKKAKGSRLKGVEVVQRDNGEDSSSEDEELHLPDDDDDDDQSGVKMKFKPWREEDMNNPTFKVGLVFPSVVEVRKAITEYGIRNRVHISMPRNDKLRVRAHCAEGCSLNLYVSEDNRAKAFVVKTYYGDHTCQREWQIKQCTSKWLAEKYLETFRADDKMSLTNFSRTVQKDWNLTPSRSKSARARRLALKAIYGDEIEQYNQLWDYGNELRRSNPGTTFFVKDPENVFTHCYMSLDACKRGFLSGCMPIICLDGCHIKTKFGGQLLTVVGVDPNDYIYPIAWAVVEVESLLEWKWFLDTLKTDLGIDNTTPWTIMTDKQKVSSCSASFYCKSCCALVVVNNLHTHVLLLLLQL